MSGNGFTDAELRGIQAFVATMRSFTQSLVRLDPASGQPVLLSSPSGGNLLSSGFVIASGARKILLSARHSVGVGGWALETPLVNQKEREVLLYKLGPAQTSRGGDLAWVVLDEAAMRHDLLNDPRQRGKSLDLPSYMRELDVRPKKGIPYGFAASNNATLVKRLDNPDLWRDGSCEVGMEYDGREGDGRYRFKLARKHKGDAYYEGASGAPIADEEGRIVSLVSAGVEDANVILGTPLADLIAEIDSQRE